MTWPATSLAVTRNKPGIRHGHATLASRVYTDCGRRAVSGKLLHVPTTCGAAVGRALTGAAKHVYVDYCAARSLLIRRQAVKDPQKRVVTLKGEGCPQIGGGLPFLPLTFSPFLQSDACLVSLRRICAYRGADEPQCVPV